MKTFDKHTHIKNCLLILFLLVCCATGLTYAQVLSTPVPTVQTPGEPGGPGRPGEQNLCLGDQSTAMSVSLSLLTGSHKKYCVCSFDQPFDPHGFPWPPNFPIPNYLAVIHSIDSEADCRRDRKCMWTRIHSDDVPIGDPVYNEIGGSTLLTDADIKKELDEKLKEAAENAGNVCTPKVCNTSTQCCNAVAGVPVYSKFNIEYILNKITYHATSYVVQFNANCGCAWK